MQGRVHLSNVAHFQVGEEVVINNQLFTVTEVNLIDNEIRIDNFSSKMSPVHVGDRLTAEGGARYWIQGSTLPTFEPPKEDQGVDREKVLEPSKQSPRREAAFWELP